MKTYLIRFTDATGKHEHTMKAGSPADAIAYVVNWCAWGAVTVTGVDEVHELGNYTCYTKVI